MDVGELRQLVRIELDRSRKDAAGRRGLTDEANRAFERLLRDTAGPLMRQLVGILRADGLGFQALTPADSARLVSDRSHEDFIELVLDPDSRPPRLIGRISRTGARQAVLVEEEAIGGGRAIADVTEADMVSFLVPAVGKLVVR